MLQPLEPWFIEDSLVIEPSSVFPPDIVGMIANLSVELSLKSLRTAEEPYVNSTLGIELSNELDPESMLTGKHFNTSQLSEWPIFSRRSQL